MLATLSHPPASYGPRDQDTTCLNINMASLPLLQRPALPQRPKLRLDTQQNRTFGKGSTSLRLDTLSAVSPTVRNTFSNAYEPATKPRLSIDSSCESTLSSASTPSSASTLASSLTSVSSDSATPTVPYKQPLNLTSILRNSPAQSLLPRRMSTSRPLFPAEKKVSFRTPLEEEIKNVRYTLAHSDIASSTSTISSLATSSSSESETSETSVPIETTSTPEESKSPSSSNPTSTALEPSSRPRGPRLGDKRDSSESDSDSCPETPVAGRRKRRRDWQWTLGPLPSDKTSSASSASSSTASEDSD